MQLVRILQVIFAIVSIPSLLGWLLISVASLISGYEWVIDYAYYEAPPDPLRGLLILFILMGWWGWFSLLWGFLFYRRLVVRYPKWVFWGNFCGAIIVLVVWVALLVAIVDSKFKGLGEVLGILCALVVFGGGPMLLLVINIILVRKSG